MCLCRGEHAGDEALELLDSVQSEEVHEADVDPDLPIPDELDVDAMPPSTLVLSGVDGEHPVVEGVLKANVVQGVLVDSKKLEIANAFRRGNLDALLATCGYQRITQEMIKVSRQEVGNNGITVHLPEKEDVAVRGYYRSVFKRKVCHMHPPHACG